MPDTNNVYLWCVAGVSLLVALNTVVRLWTERHRLLKDDLNDEDRALVWRVVIFLLFPLLILFELRSTIVATGLFGGTIEDWTYGMLWYEAVPTGLFSDKLMIPSLFAGEFLLGVMSLCLLPALLFRPHPFLSTLVGYTVAFVFGLNLVVEPILAMTGMADNKWHLAFTLGAPEQIAPLIAVHVFFAVIYLVVIRNSFVRMWFSDLTRPEASERLRVAIADCAVEPQSPRLTCRLGLMYDRAGLRRQAKRQLGVLKRTSKHSIYTAFLDAVMAYKRRKYDVARNSFSSASNYPGVDGELKASLLAASACSAFAHGDTTGALNLCERALEFDDACLVARMVKVDAFLKMGRKEQAAEEILVAMHTGLSLDLENKIPIDLDRAFESIVEIEEVKQTQPARQLVAASK